MEATWWSSSQSRCRAPRAQENARLVAHWRAKTRSWWDERAVYWRSLPPPGTLWREITLTDDQLRLLQDERLVRACTCPGP